MTNQRSMRDNSITKAHSITKAQRLQGAGARALRRLPAWLQLRLSGQPPIVVDGQTLDPQLQLVLAIQRKRSRYGLCEPTPAAGRERFRREMLIFGGPKAPVGAVSDFLIEGEGGPLPVRHYAPVEAWKSRELLVYLHGGGFVIGDLETHDEACRLLCRYARTHVLSVDYRLAPEHPFPAGLRDAVTALRWAQENAGLLGVDASSVALGGDSAGANLATVAAQQSSREHRPPAAQLLIYPPTDALTPRASHELFGRKFFLSLADREAFSGYYLSGADGAEDDPRVSPLLTPQLKAQPPALLVTAGFDLLRDEGEAYAAALKDAGTIVRARRFDTLAHGFVNLIGVCPAARRAVIRIATDWRALLDEAIA
jgi:acetyl esterase